MSRFLISALIVAILAGTCASAEVPFMAGSYFLRACDAAIRMSENEQLNSEEKADALRCYSYVAGFADGISMTAAATKAKGPVCLPDEGVSNDSAIRLFSKYLRQNPERLNQSGRMLLMISLMKAFPCK
jgi:hypothetical protein